MSRNTRLAAVIALALGLPACGSSEDEAFPESPTTTRSSVPTRMADPVVKVESLKVPWGIDFLPNGDALVTERGGRLNILKSQDPTKRQSIEVPGVVEQGEGGLLGVAVSPLYKTDSWIYVYMTTEDDNRVVRTKLSEDGRSLDKTEVVVEGVGKASNHNGGRIAFGPDEMLYVATGDASDPESSQDPNDMNGKILRMTPEGQPAPGNPRPDSIIYSLGHRNVQGLAWGVGERLYATEFGQNTFDEVNTIIGGSNYGWPNAEGLSEQPGFVNPMITWSTNEASPSGVAFAQEGPDAALYVAALKGERLWRIPLDANGEAGTPEQLLNGEYGRLRTPVIAPDGSLWIATSNSDDYGSGDDDRIIRMVPKPA